MVGSCSNGARPLQASLETAASWRHNHWFAAAHETNQNSISESVEENKTKINEEKKETVSRFRSRAALNCV